jgi:5-methylcytosine-specific restriction endonuclease McrA
MQRRSAGEAHSPLPVCIVIDKVCNGCEALRPVAEFHNDRAKKDGLSIWCIHCRRLVARRYGSEHKADVAARGRAWREAHPDKNKAKLRQFRAANRENCNEYCKRWYRQNKDTKRATVNRRKARKLEAAGTATPSQIAARVSFYGGRCAYCGGPYEHLDHVIPLARGGSNWPANLRPACGPCNLSKHTRTPAEWRT